MTLYQLKAFDKPIMRPLYDVGLSGQVMGGFIKSVVANTNKGLTLPSLIKKIHQHQLSSF